MADAEQVPSDLTLELGGNRSPERFLGTTRAFWMRGGDQPSRSSERRGAELDRAHAVILSASIPRQAQRPGLYRRCRRNRRR